MSNREDAGRLLSVLSHDFGMDIEGMLRELEEIPSRMKVGKGKIAPLKAEQDLLRSRFDARALQPSQFELERRILLSELKEEQRILYNRDPEFRTDSRGKNVKVELTDGRAEDLAHGHPRYARFVDEGRTDRRRLAELAAELRTLYDAMDVLKAKKAFLLAKLEQIKAMTYAWNGEARLSPR